MRLLYLIVDDLLREEAELAELQAGGQAAMPPDGEFIARPIPIGPRYYHESAVGLALSVPGVLRALQQWQDDFDAALVHCFVDGGVDAARTMAHIPVIGGGTHRWPWL